MPRASRSAPPGRSRRGPRQKRRTRPAVKRLALKRLLRFRMASRREEVAPMVDRVLAAARPAGLDVEQRDNLAVAVAEALSNAAVHGNRLHPRRHVRVLVIVRPRECVVVEVSDLGSGFDSTQVGDPTHPARVLMPGGRGIFLMKQLVDRVEYNEAGNRVRLTVESHAARSGKATA
jgi:anti-sigma regulatory factor (Ser/Thr protein kinase)